MPEIKAGSSTSEHKLELLSTGLAIATAVIPVLMDAIGSGSPWYIGLSAVLAFLVKISSMKYTMARTLAKHGPADVIASGSAAESAATLANPS